MERATSRAGCRDSGDLVIWRRPTGLADGLALRALPRRSGRDSPQDGCGSPAPAERTCSSGGTRRAAAYLKPRSSGLDACENHMHMPRPTSFGKDTGLQVRMAFTLFLLGALYVVL